MPFRQCQFPCDARLWTMPGLFVRSYCYDALLYPFETIPFPVRSRRDRDRQCQPCPATQMPYILHSLLKHRRKIKCVAMRQCTNVPDARGNQLVVGAAGAPGLGELRGLSKRSVVAESAWAAGVVLGGGDRVIDIHGDAVGLVAGAEPANKIVDDAGPGAVLAPEAQGLVLGAFIGEEQELVPKVAADALAPLLLHELGPEGGEVAARLLADPGAAGGGEQ